MARGEKLGFTQTPTIRPSDLKEGEEVNGQFLGLKIVPSKKYDKPMTLIRLEDVNGVEFALRANSALLNYVDALQEGQIYVFVALGSQRNEKTGRYFDAFDVFPGDAEELTFDVTAAPEEAEEPRPAPKRRALAAAK